MSNADLPTDRDGVLEKYISRPVALAGFFCLNSVMLSPENLDRLKKRLEAARADLKEQVLDLGVTPEFGSDVDNFEEKAEETEEFSKNLGIADTLKHRLKDVEDALEKMTKGAYGTCESCGGEISYEVLSVDPESRLCKDCKEKNRT